jgi:hypothetical protein
MACCRRFSISEIWSLFMTKSLKIDIQNGLFEGKSYEWYCLTNGPVDDVQENTTKWHKKGRADFCSEPERQLSMTKFIFKQHTKKYLQKSSNCRLLSVMQFGRNDKTWTREDFFLLPTWSKYRMCSRDEETWNLSSYGSSQKNVIFVAAKLLNH